MHNFLILEVLMKKWHYSTAMYHSIFARPWPFVYRKLSDYSIMFSFGVKNVKTHFFKNVLSVTKFATSSLCECEQLGAPHWKTVKMTFFKKQIFLRFSQKSQFSKTDYRFRKSYKVSSWDQSMHLFGRWSLGHTPQSKFSPFCNWKFPPTLHTSVWMQNFEISITQ